MFLQKRVLLVCSGDELSNEIGDELGRGLLRRGGF